MSSGLDANLLVRWLADRDDAPHQTEAIGAVLEDRSREFHVNLIVLVETIWTLGHSYEVGRDGIARAVRALLDHPRIEVERPRLVARALAAYESGGPGLSDHLICAVNAEAGCDTTLTFDKRAAKSPHFTLLT